MVLFFIIVFFQATDPDLEGNGLIEYRISGNNNQVIPFVVDSVEGTITPTQEFIPRDAKQYDFTATALDTPAVGDRLRAETRVIVSVILFPAKNPEIYFAWFFSK